MSVDRFVYVAGYSYNNINGNNDAMIYKIGADSAVL